MFDHPLRTTEGVAHSLKLVESGTKTASEGSKYKRTTIYHTPKSVLNPDLNSSEEELDDSPRNPDYHHTDNTTSSIDIDVREITEVENTVDAVQPSVDLDVRGPQSISPDPDIEEVPSQADYYQQPPSKFSEDTTAPASPAVSDSFAPELPILPRFPPSLPSKRSAGVEAELHAKDTVSNVVYLSTPMWSLMLLDSGLLGDEVFRACG